VPVTSRWLLLAAAIVTEVTGTLALRGAVDRPWLYAVTAVGYVVSFVALVRLLRSGLALGVVYGIWSGLGVALTAGLSSVLFDEAFTVPMVLGLLLIVGGVVMIEAGSHPPGRERP
jgi:small multidrug resistance pump